MDKVAKIRAEIERLKKCSESAKMEWIPAGYNQNAFAEDCRIASFNKLLSFIDSLQEEPAKIKKGCKYRSICNVTNNDTGNISFVAGKIYLAPEDDTLVSEENGWFCDISENASNFELVEEPASIWHDASEKPERDDLLIETNDGRIIHRQSVNNYGMVKRWAYTSDLLNLDNSCNLGNNSQEKPVSGDFEMALAEMIDKAQKCVVEPWVVAAQWKDELVKLAKGKEPASEDLEDAANNALERMLDKYNLVGTGSCLEMFKLGAEWQKKQDQYTIELAEDHAMLAGMEKMKKEMMKNAVDAVVETDANGLACINVDGVDVGDKVKVIVIKEDKDE